MDDSGCSGCGSTPMQVLAPGMSRTLIEKIEGLNDVVFKYPGEEQ
jgi:Fe-S cluster biogenesis protein NfuA